MIRLGCLLLLVAFASCSQRAYLRKEITRIEDSLHEHTGFALYDPVKKKFIYQHQADKYFTPASNTKIFTLYTSLRLLGDSVPAIQYYRSNDTLFFRGMGDASFLYRNVYDTRVTYNFLKSQPGTLVFDASNFHTDRFGAGWAWDDYPYYYQPERSTLPIYCNMMAIGKDSLNRRFVKPALFRDSIKVVPGSKQQQGAMRSFFSNQVTFYDFKKGKVEEDVPFRYSNGLLMQLLTDTLRRPVIARNHWRPIDVKILKSTPSDSLYRVMMQDSDNFIAEQLLLQCAMVLSDSLRPEIAIEYAKKNFLQDLPDEPQWVDGSGLSRFNLFTPRSIVKLWEKLSEEVPQERLFKLVAIGGKPGTLRNLYKSDVPFVFGKTGSLSNNHCLSGFVRTKKGRVLIFSFMHNNFIQPSRTVRLEMEKLIKYVHEKF
jgi:serine-type D-Ala-D-Ala carboxypeptidase/endopeptidase (penicillin-binding protein 4)